MKDKGSVTHLVLQEKNRWKWHITSTLPKWLFNMYQWWHKLLAQNAHHFCQKKTDSHRRCKWVKVSGNCNSSPLLYWIQCFQQRSFQGSLVSSLTFLLNFSQSTQQRLLLWRNVSRISQVSQAKMYTFDKFLFHSRVRIIKQLYSACIVKTLSSFKNGTTSKQTMRLLQTIIWWNSQKLKSKHNICREGRN